MATEENIELSYAEIYSNVALNDEIIITIPAETVESTKTGLKNFKSKQASKLKAEGLEPDQATLNFEEEASEEFPGCINLRIYLTRKATIRIAKLTIPEKDF